MLKSASDLLLWAAGFLLHSVRTLENPSSYCCILQPPLRPDLLTSLQDNEKQRRSSYVGAHIWATDWNRKQSGSTPIFTERKRDLMILVVQWVKQSEILTAQTREEEFLSSVTAVCLGWNTKSGLNKFFLPLSHPRKTWRFRNTDNSD